MMPAVVRDSGGGCQRIGHFFESGLKKIGALANWMRLSKRYKVSMLCCIFPLEVDKNYEKKTFNWIRSS